jgi:CRISPR system Cascade subunit CasE
MFYTRMMINPRHPALRSDQQNAYLQHRRIESLFPEHKRSDASALFRWDQQTVFIQSSVEPRFDLLPKNYTHDIQTKTLTLEQLLKPNQWLEFRLLADTSGIEAETRRRKSRDAEQLPDWLTSRLEGAAKPDEMIAIQYGSHIPVQRLEQRWKLKPTSFTGYLNVINPTLLAEVIMAGFGRSRAYGCGLMQIAPVKEGM